MHKLPTGKKQSRENKANLKYNHSQPIKYL